MSKIKIIIITLICVILSVLIIASITYKSYMKNIKTITIVNTDGSIVLIERGKLIDDIDNDDCIDMGDILK